MKTLDYAKAGETERWVDLRVYWNGMEINDAVEIDVKGRWAVRYLRDPEGNLIFDDSGKPKTYRDSGDFAIVAPDDYGADDIGAGVTGSTAQASAQSAGLAGLTWPWYRTP